MHRLCGAKPGETCDLCFYDTSRVSDRGSSRRSSFSICFSVSSSSGGSNRISNMQTPVLQEKTPCKRGSEPVYEMIIEEEASAGKSQEMRSPMGSIGNNSTLKREPIYVEVNSPLEGRRLFSGADPEKTWRRVSKQERGSNGTEISNFTVSPVNQCDLSDLTDIDNPSSFRLSNP